MRRLVVASVVSGLVLAGCGGNAGDLEAFCDAGEKAAEAAADVETARGADDLRAAYEALDVHIQEMNRTAPEEVAADMRAVDAAWDANLRALEQAEYELDELPEPEDGADEGAEIEASSGEVEEFLADECDVDFETGPR